ncbi:MAG: hypothetical protein AB8B86_20605 [Pseudomonadales bacterium]
MIKNVLLLVIGIAIGAAVMFAKDFQTESAQQISKNLALEESFDAFSNAVSDAGVFVQQHQWYESSLEQAEAYRHIMRALISALEIKALGDPDFPFFHELNTFAKSGMDNSDQRYLITMLNGAAEYRISGHRGNSKRLDFTLYKAGSPMASSFATLTTEQLHTDGNGHFEVFIGGEPRAQNWIPNDAGAPRLLIRQIHSDWENESPGQLSIDRIDEERPLYPSMSPEKMAAKLRNATDWFAADVRRWPELSRTRFSMLMPANTLTPPQDTGKEGGLSGRWMVGGHFQLEDDEALLITAAPTDAAYQGIQIGHHWWESFDYANRQSSLTADQAQLSSDGKLYFVVSAKDPAVANWLDNEGFNRGVVLMRYDGMSGALADEQKPQAKRVKIDELSKYLPQDEPQINAEQRAAAIAIRRAHVQRRFGY